MRNTPTNRMQFWKRYGTGCVILLAIAACGRFSPSAQATPKAAPQRVGARVPFIGCRSDGQLGPEDAPNGKGMVFPITSQAAQRLAYYKFKRGPGVLGPRGWYCFGTYGSSGETLYVSPQQIVAAAVLSGSWNGFDGPVIEIAYEYGGTSGRFGVASTIARVFPAHRVFVENVIKEGMEPPSYFPIGPYPKDKLVYRSKEMVEYQTPADTDGLGTNSMLKKNADPISGVAILVGQTPDLLSLSVRLPVKLAALAPIIIQQSERDAVHVDENDH